MASETSRPKLNGFRWSKWKELNPFVHYAGCLAYGWDDNRADLAAVRDAIRQHGRLGNLSLASGLPCLDADTYRDYPRQEVLHLGQKPLTAIQLKLRNVLRAKQEAPWGLDEPAPVKRITHMPPILTAAEVAAIGRRRQRGREIIERRHEIAERRRQQDQWRRAEERRQEDQRLRQWIAERNAKAAEQREYAEIERRRTGSNPHYWDDKAWQDKILEMRDESMKGNGYFTIEDFCQRHNMHISFQPMVRVFIHRMINAGLLRLDSPTDADRQ